MSNDSNTIKIGVIKAKDTARIGTKYIKNEPFVGEDGIYIPYECYTLEGVTPVYILSMSKEMFIEAYNKFILGK